MPFVAAKAGVKSNEKLESAMITKVGNYDVFISYRRKTGVNDARLLQQALRSRGYKVFFDFDSLRDGKFDERILRAIDNAPIFILMLTENALDKCANEDDWVRIEIEHALGKGRKIIPIQPSDQAFEFPETLPDKVRAIVKEQISELNKAALFEESVDKIIHDRFPYELKNQQEQVRESFSQTVRLPRWIAIIVALAGMLFGGTWIYSDKLFPYPFTRKAKQHTADMLRMVVMAGTVYDSLLNAEKTFLESAEAAVSSKSAAAMESSYGQFIHALETLPCGRCVPSSETLKAIDGMPVNKADFIALCMAAGDGVNECRQTAVTVRNLFGGMISRSDESRLRKYIADNKALCGFKGEMFAYGLLDLLQNISDSALKEFGLGSELGKGPDKWVVLGPLLARWERESSVLNNLQESVMSRMENVVNNLAGIVTAAQQDYDANKRQFRDSAKSIGLSDEQIGERIEETERNAASNVTQRLHPTR